MADNTPIVDGLSASESISTDELATQNGADVSGASPRIKIQRVKPAFGSDGDATDVDATHPLPVVQTGAIPAGSNVIGHVDVDSIPALPAGTNVIGHVDVDSLPALPAGANVIGHVDVDTLPAIPAGSNVIGHVIVDTLPATPAGTNVIGHVIVDSGPFVARTNDSISSALAVDALMNGTTVLSPLFAPITASASGATTVVAAVASKKIRVIGAFLVCAGAVSVNFQSHTTTATKTGVLPFAANGGITIPFSPTGWFETVAGEALDIDLSAAVAVGGQLVYVTL